MLDGGGFVNAAHGFRESGFVCVAAFELEEGPDQFATLVFEHSASGDFAAVIHARQFAQIGGATQTSHLGVRHRVYHAFDPRHDTGAATHGAGLLGDVKGAALESPVTDGRGCLRDGQHLGVGGGIFAMFNGIVGESDDLTFPFDHTSDGHFIRSPRVNRLVECEAHKEGVISHKLRWEQLSEGAGRWIGRSGWHGFKCNCLD